MCKTKSKILNPRRTRKNDTFSRESKLTEANPKMTVDIEVFREKFCAGYYNRVNWVKKTTLIMNDERVNFSREIENIKKNQM